MRSQRPWRQAGRERRVVGHPERAVHLHRAVEHLLVHLRRDHLDHRDVLARGALALGVHPPGGVEHHQPRLVDLHPRRGDEVLDELLLGERPAERLAVVRAPAHQLEGALRRADRAHAVVDAAGAQAVLRDREPGAALAEQVAGRHAAVLVAHLPVARSLVVAHHRHRPDALEAGRVDRHEDHARPLVRRRVGVGHDHRDRQRGPVVARGEPLVAVDDPLVAVQLGARDQPGRVGAGALRLRHREARADLAVEQRLEPALLLRVGAVLGEDLHVAGVGRRAVEDHRRDAAAAHLLAEHPVLPVGEPGAEAVVRQEQVPEALGLGALAQLDQDLGVGNARPDLGIERLDRLALDGVDVLLHELPDPVQEGGHSVGRCEIHGRGAYPPPLEGQPRQQRGARAAERHHRREHQRARAAALAGGGRQVGLEQHLVRGLRAGGRHQHVARAGRQEVRHVEAGPAAQHARHAPLEQEALDQLGLGLVAAAGHAHEVALGELRVDLAGAAVRVAQRRLERLAAGMHERHAAARAEARARVVRPAAAGAGERLTPRRRRAPPPPPAVGDPPHPHHRLVLQRDDHVAPVRIVREVDVRLRGLGRASRVRVVDPDLEALVVQLVRREQALVVELVAVGRLSRVLGRFTPSTVPSVAHRYPQHSFGASSRACAISSSQSAREILTGRRLVCGRMAPSLTRREALGGAAAAAVLASCGGGDPPPSTGPAPGSGARAARLAAGARARGDRRVRGVRAGPERRALENVRAIRAQEREHARRLERLITRPRRRAAAGRSAEEYAREFPRLESADDALRFAEDLEEREVRAYLEALTELPTSSCASEAARICADEGNHLGAIRVLQGLPAARGPVRDGGALMAERSDASCSRTCSRASTGCSRPTRPRCGATPSTRSSASGCATTSASTSARSSRRSRRRGAAIRAPAAPPPELNAALRGRDSFARYAIELEDEAVAAYSEAAAAIRDPGSASRSARSWPAAPPTRSRCAIRWAIACSCPLT